MKKFVSLALIAASLAVSARALVVGADVGYLVDSKEEYVSGRIGHVFKSGDSLTHQVELEAGFSRQKEGSARGEFLPITVNYRAESIAANKLGYYFGLGAGIAETKVKVFSSSSTDTSFAGQAFVGLSYQLTQAATFHVGAKYIWIESVRLFGYKLEVGDDIALSGGLSIKF